jgi:hypothetical protein
VTLDFVESIEEQDLPSFEVYPNPSKGVFWINGGWSGKAKLKVYNLTGALVAEHPEYYPGQSIDFRNLPDGAYILRITGQGRGFSKLIQKQ